MIYLAVGSLFVLMSCQKEEPAPDTAPAQAGFVLTETAVRIGDTLDLPVYFNKSLPERTVLAYELRGSALPGSDYEILQEPVLEAGELEASFRIYAPPSDDPQRLERNIALELLPVEGIEYAAGLDTSEVLFTVQGQVDLRIWAPDITFPQLFGYTSFGPEPVPPGRSGEFFAFAYPSRTQPDVIGFDNPNPNFGTNAFNMIRLYDDLGVTSASAKIRIPNALRFIPSEAGATSGRVEVIEQTVTVGRPESSGLPPLQVGISGEGEYDEITGIIQLDLVFDESQFGGPEAVLRKYVFEEERR